MNIVPEKSTLVVAGSFNPAILNPSWILSNVLEREDDLNMPVELTAPITGTGPTKYSFDGFAFTPSTQRLIVHLEGVEGELADGRMEHVAKLLELLPHTPITGLGFNFGFQSEEPAQGALELFSVSPDVIAVLGDEAQAVARAWGASIARGDELVGASAKLRANRLELDLNFHTSTSSIARAIDLLRAPAAFSNRLADATRFAAVFNQ